MKISKFIRKNIYFVEGDGYRLAFVRLSVIYSLFALLRCLIVVFEYNRRFVR